MEKTGRNNFEVEQLQRNNDAEKDIIHRSCWVKVRVPVKYKVQIKGAGFWIKTECNSVTVLMRFVLFEP